MRYYYILLGWLLLGISLSGRATHLLGGEIRAEATSCQGYTYRITVVLYADSASEVEFGNGVLDLGFGDPIALTDFTVTVQNADSTVVIGQLVKEVTFPGPGAYLINFRDFNRTANIVNVPNSVTTPFYIETSLVVSPTRCNSAPTLADTLVASVYVGDRYELPLRAIDADGDSLSAELVAPKEQVGSEIAGYQLPIRYDLRLLDNPVASDGVSAPTFTVSPEALVWDAPNLPGVFVVNIRINEWRQVAGEWVRLGYVTRDLTIQVVDTAREVDINELLVTDTEDAFAKPAVYLYPNPTAGPLSLEITSDEWHASTATLHNIIGETLDERTVGIGSTAYDVSSFTSGFYFINLRKGEAQQTLRFVKR